MRVRPDGGLLVFCFALRVYGPRLSRVNTPKKKERGYYPAIMTEQVWAIKDLLHGIEDTIF